MNPNQMQVKDVPTIRILMLGDPGVGKTSVTNLMATSAVTPTAESRSVGQRSWDIQVRMHEYPGINWTASTSANRPINPTTEDSLYFVEFIDPNGEAGMQRLLRDQMFKNIDGIVLVYNLKDMRSQDNLHDWLYQPLRQICRHRLGRPRSILGSQHVPILAVGTRLDQLTRWPSRRPSCIAHQVNADEILLNALDPRYFEEKGVNQEKMRRFLNRAVEFKEGFPYFCKRCNYIRELLF